MINFEWYRTFKAIYQSGTLTGAAQELLISQPNVSQHLSALENYIGHPLFERKPRQMVPTSYGKLFYTQIIESVEKLEKVEGDFSRSCVARCMTVINVGAPKEFFDARLSGNIDRIGDANLVVEFGLTKDLVAKLLKGDLNFVISTSAVEEKNIVSEPVLLEKFVLVGSPQMDTTHLKKFIRQNDIAQIEDWMQMQPWFAYSSDLLAIRRFWLHNFRKRPGFRPRFIIPGFDSILKAMQEVPGITVASDYLVKDLVKQKKLQLLWEGNEPTINTIYLAYDKTKATAVNIEAVKALFGEAVTV
ncbi:LysR family transcriptional regulator [Chitinophaga arvensicola]|uniref:DNA-binding transcriptional regulator, LysR family n=1 Tax=Chitinophaga arvensicola TaxID=29529 RepID=A0A1I0SDB4_9BACT|nr:LysR family transcriptional regulator [Chitinophaga arvensicola]SEW55934.1 DNA-binding transcriptional regulator, LysR family [Chitinophaga arvensicola]